MTVSDNYKRIGKRNEHTIIAERVLGRKLVGEEQVHHVDYDKRNNANDNLVLCSDMKYHKLLHARTDALDACGNPDYMKCAYCGKYDDPANMYVRPVQYQAWHRECRSAKRRVENPKTGPYKYGNK